jgi:putative membrane protein
MTIKGLPGISMAALMLALFSLGAPRSTAQSVSMGDKHFMKDAAEGGLAEVELGQLAEQKASDPAVRRFAEKMVNDHTKANEQLQQLAQSKNVELPTSIGLEDKATKMRLSHLSGADFDKAYMEDMVKDHKSDVSDFQKEASNAQDPDLKEFVAQTLPTLQEHLQKAQEVETKVTAQK